MQCICCLSQGDNRKEFTSLTSSDRKLYEEFMRLQLNFKSKLKICRNCKLSLKKSCDFFRLCNKSYEYLVETSKHDEYPESRRTRQSYRHDDMDGETTHLDCSQDDGSDDDDAISTLQQQHKLQQKVEKDLIETPQDEPPPKHEDIKVEDPTAKKFLCNECGSSFLTSQRLQIHGYTHSGIKNWKCEQCEKVFATKFRLKSHSRVHSGERPFICDICDLTFAQGNALKCHKRVHTKERPFACKYCPKKFSQNTTLKTHTVALHLGKTVECDEPGCDKKFTRRSYLLIHKRDHLGERKYTCDRCPNQYKQKSHLDRHIEASHLGIRHKCDFPGCTSEFSKSWTLKMHKFVHTSEKSQLPYQCSTCDVGFQRRDAWLKHMSKTHSSDAEKNLPGVTESIESTGDDPGGTNYVVLASTPEIYTIQNPDGSYTQVQTLQVVENN